MVRKEDLEHLQICFHCGIIYWEDYPNEKHFKFQFICSRCKEENEGSDTR